IFFRWSVRRFVGRASIKPSQFQSAFDRFRTAVREKDMVHSRPLRQLLGKRPLKWMVIKVGKVNCAGSFAANRLHDAGMRMPECIDRDTTQKIQILFAVGVKYIGAATMRQHERRALIRWQQEFIGLRDASVELRFAVMRSFGDGRFASNRLHGFRFGSGARHATVTAAWGAELRSRTTRVPGISSPARSAPRQLFSSESVEPPPTIFTSRTPPSIARFAASSFSTMPPDTTRACTRLSISSHAIADKTLSPSKTPATSV